jgi:molybdate transport system substrate-binding protein
MKSLRHLSCLLCAGALLSCAFLGQALAAELYVSGAASLTNAFDETKAAFEKKHPGVKVLTNYAASNPLLKQMQEGAPVDVFATADQQTMDKAQAAKLVKVESRRNFALNDLVMIVPADSRAALKDVKGLTMGTVKKIAVGNPDSVPAGRYAKASLARAGLWEELQPKYIMAASVRQALDYVSRGEVDAGFVYRTDALKAGDKVKIVCLVEGHDPVLYPIAVGTTGKNQADGQKFVDFVTGPEGQAILKKYGFSEAK